MLQKFLQFFNNQNCLGLNLFSCFSGGKSSLLHLPPPQGNRSDNAENSFPLNFPLFLNSIGDFPAVGTGYTRLNRLLYQEELAKFLCADKEETVAALRRRMQKVEKTDEEAAGVKQEASIRTLEKDIEKVRAVISQEEIDRVIKIQFENSINRNKKLIEKLSNLDLKKNFRNLSQVYFPCAKDSPGGFRAIGECGESFALTYLQLQKAKLSSVLIQPTIIDHKRFLELHPIVIDIPIAFNITNPHLLSMIPGQAQHYLQQVSLHNLLPYEYIKNSVALYTEAKIGVNKAFFIGKLISPTQTLEQIVLLLGKSGLVHCLLREGQTFFSWDGQADPIAISAMEYAWRLMRCHMLSTPTDPAVRSQTAGQQDKAQLLEALCSEEFWNGQDNILIKYSHFFRAAQFDPFLLEQCKDFSHQQLLFLAFHLLHQKGADQLKSLIEQTSLSVAITDPFNGQPLLLAAIASADNSFIQYLLEKGADVNVCDDQGDTALHHAVKQGQEAVVDLLLNTKGITIDKENREGCTPLEYACTWNHLEIFQKLKASGALLTEKAFFSLSAENIKHYMAEGLEFLKGNVKMFFAALDSGDEELLRFLLAIGADPYEESEEFNAPILSAIKRCHPRMVQLFIDHEGFNPNFIDDQGNSLLAAAICRGNAEIITALYAKSDTLPIEGFTSQLLLDGLSCLKACGELETLKSIFQGTLSPLIMRDKPEWVCEFFRLGIFGDQYFLLALHLLENDFDLWQGVITQVLQEGYDLNKKQSTETPSPLQYACEMLTAPVVKFLIEQGAQPQPNLDQILLLGDLDLAQLVIEKKALERGELSVEAYKKLINKAIIASVLSGKVQIVRVLKEWGILFSADYINNNHLLARGFLSGGKEMVEELMRDNEGVQLTIKGVPTEQRTELWEKICVEDQIIFFHPFLSLEGMEDLHAFIELKKNHSVSTSNKVKKERIKPKGAVRSRIPSHRQLKPHAKKSPDSLVSVK